MKKTILFAFLAMGMAVVACNSTKATTEEAQEAAATEVAPAPEKVLTAKDFKPSKAEIDSVSYLVGINFGVFIKNYNFGDLNYAALVKGIKEFVNAKGDPRSEEFVSQFKHNPNSMNDAFNAYLEKMNNYTSLVNKEKEEKFLSANAKKAGITVTESGLQYTIIEAGNEIKPAEADTVWVRYKGALTDGTVFDQVAEDAEPISFTLGQVIPGWREGMQLVGEGGKIKLYIPSKIGYGESGNQSIPGCSTLIFDVELVKVGKFVAPEEAAE